MANRAITAKCERAARQRREAAQAYAADHAEFYATWRDGAGTPRAALALMVAGFKGEIVKCPRGPHHTDRRRAGFVADRSSIKPGLGHGSMVRVVTPDMYSTETRLIPRR